MKINLAASLLMVAVSASAQQIRAVPKAGLAPVLGTVVLSAPTITDGWQSFGPEKLDLVRTGVSLPQTPAMLPLPQAVPAAIPAPAVSYRAEGAWHNPPVKGFQPDDSTTRELVSGFDAAMNGEALDARFDGAAKSGRSIEAERKSIPREASVEKKISLNDFMVAAFIKLAEEKMYGSSARMTMREVVERIYAKMPTDPRSQAALAASRWSDVEPLFRKAGWKVVYDKSGADGTLEPAFVFTKLADAP